MLRPSRIKSRKEPDTGLTPAELSEVRTKSPHLDDKALRSALQNFRSLDHDNDGRLSQEEFREGLGMLGMDPTFSSLLFNSFDTGGDGYIDRREFVAAMAVMLHPDNVEDQIDLAFDAYDVNKDGMLTYEELRDVIASVFSTMEQMGIANDQHNPEVVANELFHNMDRGAKGYVTKEDYLHLARTHPEHLKQVGLGGANSHRRRSRRASSLANFPAPKQKVRRGGNPRKRGTTVTFGHEKWELVVQMMLGIRLAVGHAAEAANAMAGEAGLARQSSSTSDRDSPSVTPQPSGPSERADGPSEPTGDAPSAVAAAAPAAAAPPAKKNGRASTSEVHVTLEPGAAVGHEAGAPGTSAMHSVKGAELRATDESRRLNALRGTSSRGRFDRSEPFTVLLHKSSKAEKLGIKLSSPGADGLVLVHELVAGGIAARSGKLRVGDVLVAVNETDVSEHAVASGLLRAAEGELTLKISGQIDADRLCDEVVKFRIPSHHRGHDRHIYFKDYAPQAYRRIRQLFGVSEREYMLSLGPEQIMGELLLGTMGSLSELMSEGKSGSFFYYSNDALCAALPFSRLASPRPAPPSPSPHVACVRPCPCVPPRSQLHPPAPQTRPASPHTRTPTHLARGLRSASPPARRYMIKKIPQREMSSLRRLLSQYVRHVERYPHTLLPRFMGAHRLIVPEIGKVHFVVFSNVFSTDRVIHERYDLKGSTLGRTVGAEALAKKTDVLRKDLDLKRKFHLGRNKAALLEQIRADVRFLREVQTMDYSLLCGIHFPRREPPVSERRETAAAAATPASPSGAAAAAAATPPPPPDSPRGAELEAGAAAAAAAAAGDGATPPPADDAGSPPRSCAACASASSSGVNVRAASNSLSALRVDSVGVTLPLRGGAGAASGSNWTGPTKSSRAPWEFSPDGAVEGCPDDGAEPEIYFIGIIDILTAWSPAKSMENLAKKVIHPSEKVPGTAFSGISCVPPDEYADRFERALVTWLD